jgi:cation transport ATPase
VDAPVILHETPTRLRLQLPGGAEGDAVIARLRQLPAITALRANRRAGCVVVCHHGDTPARDAILEAARVHRAADRTAGHEATRVAPVHPRPSLRWAQALLAATVPVAPRELRPAVALTAIATRTAVQTVRGSAPLPAALLDAASLAALAVNGQPLVVSASVLLRLLGEGLSDRMIGQADALLAQVLPEAATHCTVRRSGGPGRSARWRSEPLRRVRPGDRIRLRTADVVPLDGWIEAGRGVLHSVMLSGAERAVGVGDLVKAGERIVEGTLEVIAEASAAGSRLERLRSHVAHASAAREPTGRLTPDLERLASLPLTGAALVFGLTGDPARAAAMLQADPLQGIDLALPVAREATLYALARHGLLTSGLEGIERLALARTIVLQDTGVLATGRWTVADVQAMPGGDPNAVRGWLAELAALPPSALSAGGIGDARIRRWVRDGTVLRTDRGEVHLASARRLHEVWGEAMPESPRHCPPEVLERRFAVVAQGRVIACATLHSRLRDDVPAHLDRLGTLGFDRVALYVEDDGQPSTTPAQARADLERFERVPVDPIGQREWFADATRDGIPPVIVHTVLRDRVPPGGLALVPADADIGAHGVLLGDPLRSLESARILARTVRSRLHVQRRLAVGANAALMTASALRWVAPLGSALLHHGFALAVLLDSLRLESLSVEPPEPTPSHSESGRER